MSDVSVRAYLAGFFDGEGSVLVSKGTNKNRAGNKIRPCHSLVVSVSQQDKSVLNLLCERYGGNVRLDKSYGEWRKDMVPCYRFRVVNLKAMKFLEDIKDFVIVKKDEVELALQWPLYLSKSSKDSIDRLNKIERREKIMIGLRDIRSNRKDRLKHDYKLCKRA